jgi:hypothetical protein
MSDPDLTEPFFLIAANFDMGLFSPGGSDDR